MNRHRSQLAAARATNFRAGKAADLLCAGVVAGLALVSWGPSLEAETVRVGSNPWTHGAESVAVTGEALVHTAQLLAVDSAGNIAGGHDATAQSKQMLDNVQAALAAAGARLADTVKLNLYVRQGGLAAAVVEAVKQRFPQHARPAISLVVTALPHPDALVGCDAVATRSSEPPGQLVERYRSPALFPPGPAANAGAAGKASHAALLRDGPRAYVSGQAARGGDLREATLFTLDRLRENLEFLGLGLSDTVQVKSFLKPMSAAGPVEEAIHEFFGGETPPLVFVEWSNAEPIEIELIAAGRPRSGDSTAAIEYLTAPGERTSPVFSRIAWLEHPTTVYFSGLYSESASDELAQIRNIFAQLEHAARRARTDLRHLAKATYYVTSDEVGNQLTEIRKGLYDPERPPAASKATVAGAGVEGRVFTMDMIAVPASAPGASR
jgi:enamine deaminase RidA (YjgF/YER057c/UK114 family)